MRRQCRVDFHTDEGLEAGCGLVEGARPRVADGHVEPRVEVLGVVFVLLRSHYRKVAPRVEDVARREGRDAGAAARRRDGVRHLSWRKCTFLRRAGVQVVDGRRVLAQSRLRQAAIIQNLGVHFQLLQRIQRVRVSASSDERLDATARRRVPHVLRFCLLMSLRERLEGARRVAQMSSTFTQDVPGRCEVLFIFKSRVDALRTSRIVLALVPM